MKNNQTLKLFFILTCLCLFSSSCKEDKEDDHDLNEYFSNLHKNYTDLLGKEVNPAKWHEFAPIFGPARKVEVTYYRNSEWDSVKQKPIPKEIDYKLVRYYNKDGFVTEMIRYKYGNNEFHRTSSTLIRLNKDNKPITHFNYEYSPRDSTKAIYSSKNDYIYHPDNLTVTIESYRWIYDGFKLTQSQTYYLDMTGRVDYNRAVDEDSSLNKETDKRSTSYYYPYEDIKKLEKNNDGYGNWTVAYTLYYSQYEKNPYVSNPYRIRTIIYY